MQKQIVTFVVYDPSNNNRQIMTQRAEAVIYRRGDDPQKRATSAYYEPVGKYYVRRGHFWVRVKMVGNEFRLEITALNFLKVFLPHMAQEKFLNVCTSQQAEDGEATEVRREASQGRREGEASAS